MSFKHEKQVCNLFHNSMEIIGKRWTGAILVSMMDGPKRFNEFHTMIPEISSRLLTERLKEIEDYGLVTRTVISDRPIQVIYALTEKGSELQPILQLIGNWAARWDSGTNTEKENNITEKVLKI